jgi:hypothetical protein
MRRNYGPKKAQASLASDTALFNKLAARGSFIFVKGGSLYQAAQELNIEVKAE